MDKYIKGNKEAWEEAFELRHASWGQDITARVKSEAYPFFNEDTVRELKRHELGGKTIGQFCSNNGRELLSLVKTVKARAGIGFDIAENMVRFANEKAKELSLPCTFIAVNALEIGDEYENLFDAVLITIGALCWFRDLNEFFAVVSKCMKKGGIIIINEAHPLSNMIAVDGVEGYDKSNPQKLVFSYFEHEWISNDGMKYITGKNYTSKTFIDYTHTLSDVVGSMCANNIVISDIQEFQYDIGGGLKHLDNKGIPLSMIITGRKE